MSTESLVKDKLAFLITEYGFQYAYYNDRGDHFVFTNAYGRIKFYQWQQFREEAIIVNHSGIDIEIDLSQHYPEIYSCFIHRYRGIRAVLLDRTDAYWEMVGIILRKEINQSKKIFGLEI